MSSLKSCIQEFNENVHWKESSPKESVNKTTPLIMTNEMGKESQCVCGSWCSGSDALQEALARFAIMSHHFVFFSSVSSIDLRD